MHRHDSVELEADSGDELGTHDPVQHLVEVNEAIVDVDSHLENDPVDLLWRRLVTKANHRLHAVRQQVEEVRDVLRFHFDARVPICPLGPSCLEVFKVKLESHQWVVRFEVEFLKLLDDDEDEQVEHDVRDDHDEAEEEDRSDATPTSLALIAVGCCVHRVIHDSVPVFACRDREE